MKNKVFGIGLNSFECFVVVNYETEIIRDGYSLLVNFAVCR